MKLETDVTEQGKIIKIYSKKMRLNGGQGTLVVVTRDGTRKQSEEELCQQKEVTSQVHHCQLY